MGILVGTSGFDYKDWRGPFYPRFLKSGDRLAFYAEHFDTVELNVTFYRMPKAEAFRGWRDAVPDDFRFAVKASRYLTHIRRLEDPQGPVEFLMERASELGDKLGPVLLQLPPNLVIDLDRMDATLSAFRGAVPVAVEPRHKSWFVPELCDLLRRYDAAFVHGRPARADHAAVVDGVVDIPAAPPGESHSTAVLRRPRPGELGRPPGRRPGRRSGLRLLQQRPPGLRGPQRPDLRAATGAALTVAALLCLRY